MILRPLVAAAEDHVLAADEPVPAWSAVAMRQKCQANGYWLISQSDHAKLSGELAANFVSESFPAVDALMARIIAVHDTGWTMFPEEANPTEPPLLTAEGKPLAFIEFTPQQAQQAWTASIEHAENLSPAGGIVVSRHFCDLGKFRLENGNHLAEDDRQSIVAFTEREHRRQQRLLAHCTYSAPQLDSWLAVLKFCDLLSLYLCSGAAEEVQFPVSLAGRLVRISRAPDGNLYRLDPSPFQAGPSPQTISLSVTARYYPAEDEPKLTTLVFLLR